jgi:hypothetical protein
VCALRDHQVVSVANEDSVSLQYYGVATCELVRVSDALAIVDGRGELYLLRLMWRLQMPTKPGL